MKIKKRFITLMEIMIVIFLITLIGGVIGYNMKGTLEKGKAFKTEQAKNQLDEIFQLEAAKGERTHKQIISDAYSVLEKSGLVRNPNELLKDGWGHKFDIQAEGDNFVICSQKYNEYCDKYGINKNDETDKDKK